MSAGVPRRVALVTGGNKGIGYAICKSLSSQTSPPLTVLLGSRDEQRGLEAVARLRSEQQQQQQHSVDVQALVIDIADEASVKRAAERVKQQYGGLDILVSNAGIASKGDAFDENIARDTLRTNYWGHTRPAHTAHLPPHRPRCRHLTALIDVAALRRHMCLCVCVRLCACACHRHAQCVRVFRASPASQCASGERE